MLVEPRLQSFFENLLHRVGLHPLQLALQGSALQRLGDIAADPRVRAEFLPLYDQHLASIGLIKSVSRSESGVVFFDLADKGVEGYNKFIPYYLFPECVYSVGLSRSSFRTKVAVGSNPWTERNDLVNLAAVCERYGGGGHARVGAISFPPDKFEQANKAAQEIVAELRASFRRARPIR